MINCIFFGWNDPIPGREPISAEHFQDFIIYVDALQRSGTITSYDSVFLNHHGGNLNGFFLIKGEPAKLAELMVSEAWEDHMLRATFHLQSPGWVGGFTGDLIPPRFAKWQSMMPK